MDNACVEGRIAYLLCATYLPVYSSIFAFETLTFVVLLILLRRFSGKQLELLRVSWHVDILVNLQASLNLNLKIQPIGDECDNLRDSV